MRLAVALGLAAGCGFSAPAGQGPIDAAPSRDADALDPDATLVDGSIDAPPGAACYGSAFGRVCLSSEPTGATAINAPSTIDTDSPAMCAATVAGTTIANACVVAAGSFSIDNRLAATGSRPLVLVADGAITINMMGVVDVSSRGTTRGAGAATTCLGATLPGTGGGGAGGSFSGAGGNGGSGTGGAGGVAAPASQLTVLRGGCPGTNGHGGAVGANGGGAVLLIASAITINGRIEANGSGGGAAAAGDRGGGGGGSGGTIILDTMNLTFNASGRLSAQGGGGGGGSSNNTAGGSGGDPVAVGQAAFGGAGGGNGGSGGAGGTGGAASPGTAGSGNSGGGGGGGGAGYIRSLDPAFAQGGMAVPNFN